MNETEIFPAPHVPELALPPSEFRLNQAYFRANLTTLLDSYRDKYVAIRNGNVVAVGDSFVETASAAYAKCGYVSVYVDLVTDIPRAPERLPFFREVHAP